MEISAIDVNITCRTCLQSPDYLESLFETKFDDSPLADLLIQVNPSLPRVDQEDKLSRQICAECRNALISAYKFQQLCMENDVKIRQHIDQQIKIDVHDTFKTEDQSLAEIQSDLTLIDPTLDIALQNDSNDVMLTELKPLDDEFESETQENSNDEDDSMGDSDDSSDSESEMKPLNCETCNASFNSSSKLERHIRRTHQARKSKSAGSEDNESSDEDDDMAKLYTCDTCPKKFKKQSLLARHIKTHDPNKRPHECQKCNKRFPSQVSLVRHSVIHSELVERSKINRPEAQDFSCVICGRAFKSSESLSTHLKTHKGKSEEDQEYECKICHDVFPTFTDILRHSKNHIENATHKCAICSKLFVVGDELIDHFLRHKGMKPHQCPVCEKSFLKLHKLNVHMRIHSDDKVNDPPLSLVKRSIQLSSSPSTAQQFPMPRMWQKFVYE